MDELPEHIWIDERNDELWMDHTAAKVGIPDKHLIEYRRVSSSTEGKDMNENDIHPQDHIVSIGKDCFGLADGSLLSWRGQNYVPQKESLWVRLRNWWVQWQNNNADYMP